MLTKKEEEKLQQLIEKYTNENGIDLIGLNEELNAPFKESNKKFWEKLLGDN